MDSTSLRFGRGLTQNPAFQISNLNIVRLARLPPSRNDFNHPKQSHNCIESIVALGESFLNHAKQRRFQCNVELRRPYLLAVREETIRSSLPDRKGTFKATFLVLCCDTCGLFDGLAAKSIQQTLVKV
jgi:hypothetical protein